MKTLLKVIGILIVVIIIAALGGLAYFKSKFPADIAIEDIKVEATPERLARGEYLGRYVMGCIDCHSQRDLTRYSAPVKEGTYGMGGMEFSRELAGVPGSIFAKNITPAGIGDYTDGELLRVITTGINKKGEAMFPMMPYMHYGHGVSREDLYCVIAYIRSLKPIENTVPERKLDFPMNFIVNTIPVPANIPDAIPPKADSVAYGAYITNAVACMDCHTKFVKGVAEPGMEYAGGFEFNLPNGDKITSSNITPDMSTGIGALSKENFIAKFKTFASPEAKNVAVANHAKNTVMPWTELAQMTEEDLGAVYVFLRTLKPVKNEIVTFRPGMIDL